MLTILKSIIQLLSQLDWSSFMGSIGKGKVVSKPEVSQPKSEPKVEPAPKVKKYVEIISFQDYITASGKYNERLSNKELDDEKVKNAYKLIERVNNLLNELEVYDVKVSSGFRPSTINAGIAGAAKKSAHLSCEAVDLALHPKLDKITIQLLEKHGLYLENPKHTISWRHLQIRPTKSGNRIFTP
jgi:hypothetical protein